MAKIGGTSCADSNLNTGFGRCTWEPGLIKGAYLIPKGTYVLNTDIDADPQTFIEGKVQNDNPLLRWYKMPTFVGLEPSTTEASKETFGYGSSERAGQDFVSWMFKFRAGKMCAYKGVESFDGQYEKYDILFVDDKGKVIGYKKVVADVTRMYGFSLTDIYVKMWEPASNSANVGYNVEFSFEDSSQLKHDLIGVDTGVLYSDIVAIQDTVIEWFSSAGSGVFQVYLYDGCGGNLGETYGTELAVTSAWLASNIATGAAITVSSVSYSTLTKRFTIDLDQADGDYSTTANNIRLKLAAPSVLSGLGVEWYENGTAGQAILTGT